MMRFRRLSAAGASALSIWELHAEAGELQALFGESLPSQGAPLRLDRNSLPFDEALLWVRQEDRLECHLHGGFGVAAAFRDWLLERGWQEDEGDVPQVSRATSPLAARAALALEEGRWQAEMERIAGLEESARRQAIAELMALRPWARLLERPARLVLAGAPDVGKSTLFNLWHRASLATTASGAGTTRDPVIARIGLGEGWDRFHVELVDSAGLGPAQGALDAAAMAMTRTEIASAWRVVWVLDAATPPAEEVLDAVRAREPEDLVLLHRLDLGRGWEPECHGIAVDLEGHRDLGGAWIEAIERALLARLGPVPEVGALIPMGGDRRRQLEDLQRSQG